jgi:hypothetical protein
MGGEYPKRGGGGDIPGAFAPRGGGALFLGYSSPGGGIPRNACVMLLCVYIHTGQA